MKKIFLLFLFLSYSAFSQSIKIENGIFYTIIENGIGQNKKVKFKISKETVAKIKLTDNYKTTLNDKSFLKANKEKRKISDPLVVHLYGTVNGAVLSTTRRVKNKISFDFVENTTGEISFDENNELIIKFYFKSKNDIGNEITSLCKYNDKTNEVYISD